MILLIKILLGKCFLLKLWEVFFLWRLEAFNVPFLHCSHSGLRGQRERENSQYCIEYIRPMERWKVWDVPQETHPSMWTCQFPYHCSCTGWSLQNATWPILILGKCVLGHLCFMPWINRIRIFCEVNKAADRNNQVMWKYRSTVNVVLLHLRHWVK